MSNELSLGHSHNIIIEQSLWLSQLSVLWFKRQYMIIMKKFSQGEFDKAIWKVVSGIAPGHVMSYGAVARIAGFPRHARMVSKAMCRSATPLPWYRVVRTDQTIAFEVGSKSYKKQKGLLQKEGVRIVNGKVIPLKSTVDLDKLLWG